MSATFDFAPLDGQPLRAGLDGGFGAPIDVAPAVDPHGAGFAAGMEDARVVVAQAVGALDAAAQALAATRDQLCAEVERQAVELGLKIAEQALHAVVKADPEVVLESVRGALRLLVEREYVTVVINPADLEIVRESSETLQGELGGLEHIEIQGDRRIPAGGAIVRTVEGEVDATLETKLERAREVLERELTNS